MRPSPSRLRPGRDSQSIRGLNNGLGHYEEALAAAESASKEGYQPMGVQLVLPELIEAAVRSGRTALAEDAMSRLATMTVIDGADWGMGLEARSRALVSDRADAEHWYTEAVVRLGRTPLRPELARAHLLYGEWLRRENRRLDARQQLRTPQMFVAMRARRWQARTAALVRHRRRSGNETLTTQRPHPRRKSTSPGSPETDAPIPEIGGALHQRAHRRMAPAQGVHETRHHLAQGPGAPFRRAVDRPNPTTTTTRQPSDVAVPGFASPRLVATRGVGQDGTGSTDDE